MSLEITYIINHFILESFMPCSSRICYPFESSTIPGMLLLLVTVILLVFIRFIVVPFFAIIIRNWSSKKEIHSNIENHQSKFTWKEIIFSLMIPIAVLAVPFFISTPLLMYEVSEKSINSGELNIVIYNFGLTAAKNAIISIDTNNENIKIYNFTSKPALPFTNNNSNVQFEDAFFKIDVLPPASLTNTLAKIEGLGNSTVLTVYLRSDQWVGYHQLITIGVIYILVTGFAILVLFGKNFVRKLLTTT